MVPGNIPAITLTATASQALVTAGSSVNQFIVNPLTVATATALTASGKKLAGSTVAGTCSITRDLAMYVANHGPVGTNPSVSPGSTKPTIVAGYGAPTELNGANTGAGFNCPFGIATDAATVPSLYVTDFGGNAVRNITNLN